MKRSTQEKEITTLNMHAPNIGPPKDIKVILIDL
jgi:hypothetical protein